MWKSLTGKSYDQTKNDKFGVFIDNAHSILHTGFSLAVMTCS